MPVFKVLRGIQDVHELLDQLDKVRQSGQREQWTARCPNHEDGKPSLSIGVRDDKILLHCHAGCETQEIIEKLGFQMSDLFMEAPTLASAPEAKAHACAIYPYYDSEGVLRYEVVRYEPKGFSQRQPNGRGGYQWNLDGVQKLVYRLPQILTANGAHPIYVAEGEKDAETLAALGLVSTTLPGGTDARWQDNYTPYFVGKDVVILPDNDKAGERYAEKIVEALHGKAKSLRVVNLPGLPYKGDVTDWMAAHTTEELLQLVDQTKPHSAEGRFELLRADEVTEEDDEPMEYVVEGILTKGSVSVFTGAPEAMKTWMLLDMASCVATGRPWVGKATIKGGVLLIDEESGRKRLKKRLRMLKRGHTLMNWHVPITCAVLGAFNPREPKDIQDVEELIRKEQAICVIIDAFADILSGADENLTKDVGPIMRALRGIAERQQVAIVVIHHTNRQGLERGSSAIKGAVDLMLLCERRENSNVIDLKSIKARDVEPFKLSVVGKFAEDGKSFHLAMTMPKPEQPRYTASETAVLDYIKANGASTIKGIHAAGSFSESTITQSVHNLVKKDILARTDAGTRGQVGVYALRSTSDEENAEGSTRSTPPIGGGVDLVDVDF